MMKPKQIIFYTRLVQIEFHIELARFLRRIFPHARVLFVSFFSQAVAMAKAEGFEAVHFPDVLNQKRFPIIGEERIREFDRFCRQRYYGLNTMLQTERFLPRTGEAQNHFLLSHLTALDNIVTEETLSISSMYDHFVYLAAGLMAFEKGGAHFAFVGCGIPGGHVVGLQTPNETWQVATSKVEARGLWKSAKEKLDLPLEQRIDYMKMDWSHRPFGRSQQIKLARERGNFRQIDFRKGSYFESSGMNWALASLQARLRCLRTPDPSRKWDIAADDQLREIDGPCVYLALHMEPEATILMYSPFLRDQREVVRLTAEAVPLGYTVLVKENPKMAGKRKLTYYDRLRAFHNVKLLAPNVSSIACIQRSEAVVSIAGTVTMEAMFLGKPAFCFGKPPFYRCAKHYGIGNTIEALSKIDSGQQVEADDEIHNCESHAWSHWVQSLFCGNGAAAKMSERTGIKAWDDIKENVENHGYFICNATQSKIPELK